MSRILPSDDDDDDDNDDDDDPYPFWLQVLGQVHQGLHCNSSLASPSTSVFHALPCIAQIGSLISFQTALCHVEEKRW